MDSAILRVPCLTILNALNVATPTSILSGSNAVGFTTLLNIFRNISWFSSNTATATLSGTSMASPHVAGVAALYKQANPSASATTIRNAIVNNASLNKISNVGTGSPNRLLYSLFF